MQAAASAAFQGDDEGPSVASRQDRQLHLVFGLEAGSPAPPAAAGAPPDCAVPASSGVVTSLAEYALGLRAGDPCFCCGRALTASESPGEGGGGRSLECVECGVFILGPE